MSRLTGVGVTPGGVVVCGAGVEVAAKVPSSTTELYERVVAEDVQEARARALAILRRRGVHTIDVPAERLTVATIQRYLELKSRYL